MLEKDVDGLDIAGDLRAFEDEICEPRQRRKPGDVAADLHVAEAETCELRQVHE